MQGRDFQRLHPAYRVPFFATGRHGVFSEICETASLTPYRLSVVGKQRSRGKRRDADRQHLPISRPASTTGGALAHAAFDSNSCCGSWAKSQISH